MPRHDSPARSLSIFLLKNEFASPNRAMLDVASLDHSQVIAGGTPLGDLYVKPTSDRTPKWLSLFIGSLDRTPRDLHNASAAAVFLIRAAGRMFALTFGYGRMLLRPGAWE
ncbi:MAG TPA: DUF6119 family protein, partial [Burkholderiales bacterium]|nr:DUF6119 family protein [Burkholderiales bacterium]